MEHARSSDELTFREMQMLGRMTILSTAEMGCVLQVSDNKAAHMLDSGTVPGKWMVPGKGNFRRIDRTKLLQYLRSTGSPRADIIDPITLELVAETNGKANGTVQCADGFTLGMTLASRPVREIVVHANAMPSETLKRLIEMVKDRFAAVSLPPPPIQKIML